jgi:hypothetical protein
VKKKLIMVGIIATAAAGTSVGVVFAATQGPHTTAEAASFVLDPTSPPVTKTCVGPDNAFYATVTGTWSGTQTATRPFFSGKLILHSTAVANLATGVGIATGTTTLKDPVSGAVRYTGSFAQNLQVTDSNLDVVGRGGVDLAIYSNGSPTGGSLIAQQEFSITGPNSSPHPNRITGGFGGPTSGTPDFAALWNGMHC